MNVVSKQKPTICLCPFESLFCFNFATFLYKLFKKVLVTFVMTSKACSDDFYKKFSMKMIFYCNKFENGGYTRV